MAHPLNLSKAFRDVGAEAPPPTMLYDAYGVPLPNSDQRDVDIHGRSKQPEFDPEAYYSPAVADEEGLARRKHAMRLRVVIGQRISQDEADEVRRRVMMWLARDVLRNKALRVNPKGVPLRHLWFDTPSLEDYELRLGNAPADPDRPAHLRGLRLAIDVQNIPREIQHVLRPGGQLDCMVQDAMDESDNPKVSSAQVLAETINRMAHTVAWNLRD